MPKSVATAAVESGFTACERCRASHLCRMARTKVQGAEVAARIVLRYRQIRRGDYLYRMGDPLHSLGVICSGSVKTCLLLTDGSVQVTGFHIAGELTGMGGVNTKQHTCDAMALESTCVCEILFSQMQELCHDSPDVRRDVLQLMFDQIEHGETQLLPLVGKKSATERLAAFLLSLAQRLVERGFPGEEFSLSMSRHDISNYLGLAKETVSRLLTRLESEGVISLDVRKLRLNDPQRLARLAVGTAVLH
jgi:CRP/FNR family transcriptional regulator